MGLIIGILLILLAIFCLIVVFVAVSEDEPGDAILAFALTIFFGFLGVTLVKSYLHPDIERFIECSEYRIEEQITYSTDSIVDKTYIIYYKK